MSGTDVLVLGAGGRVGEALVRLLPAHGLTVRGVAHSGPGGVDVCRDDEVSACLEQYRPRTVVYAAAIADPDRCERDPTASYAINVLGADKVARVARVARVAGRAGCRVVYCSSDYVFGTPGRYFEDASPAPLQVYGRHKAEAEQLVLSRGDNVVIRLPLLFGSRDFVADAVQALVTGTVLSTDDRRRYPIPLEHVARVTAATVAADSPPGIYHAAGADAVTKAEWMSYIAGLLGRPVPPAAPASDPVAPRPVDVELATRDPWLRTTPGALWVATGERVAELSASAERD